MDRLVISGIGIVSPRGFGREALERILCEDSVKEQATRVPEFSLEDYLTNARSFRRVAEVTRFALAGMALAIADAGFAPGLFGGEKTGLVVGITHGAVSYGVQFDRTLLLEGPLSASPLHFSESVPNAPAGNGAMAFQIQGPVHTLIGEEPVGAQVIDLAAGLLREGRVERCLVVGAEEWNEVVAHAYAQIDRVARRSPDPDDAPPLRDGAAALVLELESSAVRRGASPHAVIAGWRMGRGLSGRMEQAIAEIVREVFRSVGRDVSAADHIVLPTGRHRRAARQGIALARGEAPGPPTWIDLLPAMGNPAGASNLLQMAASAVLLSGGRVGGPGLALSTGILGTLSATVLSRADQSGIG
jgi:3-oxoacyl-[acyl-carrier-protein] synthase II